MQALIEGPGRSKLTCCFSGIDRTPTPQSTEAGA